MGALNLPPSGSVYVDAQSFIYTVEKFPQYLPVLRPLWAAVSAGTLRVVTSERSISECLVMPYRRADATLVADFETLFRDPGVSLVPITPAILRDAARLRAAITRFRTPDAIHAATALAAPAALVVTNDLDFRNVPGLPVEVLRDVIARP